MITIYSPGHLDYFDSYGLIACQLLRHLNQNGSEAHAIALGESKHESQPADIAELMKRPLAPTYGGVLLGYPTTHHHYGELATTGTNIALTMFESSKIPPEWVPILNQNTAVIVPSEFCKKSFEDCGVTVPIHVIPLGINDVYQPVKRDRTRPLTFLAFLDRGARKGGHAAIQAFCLAFGDRQDVKLVLKSRDPKVRVNITNDNIDVIQRDMNEGELAALYGRCDVLINANKGEGFGLIPREFAATGGVALATNWSGTADDIEKWGYPLGYELVPADWRGIKKFEKLDLGQWAEPNIESLAQFMQVIAQSPNTYLTKSYSQSFGVRKLYDWSKFAQSVYEVWHGHSETN